MEITKVEKVFGFAHSLGDVLSGHFAAVLESQGMWKDGEELRVRALESDEKAVGEDHIDTLSSIKNLALILKNQESIRRLRRWVGDR